MNAYKKLCLLVTCSILSAESLAMQKALRPFLGTSRIRQYVRHMSVLDWLTWTEASDASNAAGKTLKNTYKIASDLEKIIENQVILDQKLDEQAKTIKAMEQNISLLVAQQTDSDRNRTQG